MLQLYSADGCPYAQRARALLSLRQEPFKLRTIDLANKPADFLELSPTGRVPMLIDGEAKLYESYVINEYLRERTDWKDGLSQDVYQRARERLAMLQFDNVVVPIAWASMKAKGALDDAQRKALDRELDELQRTMQQADARVSLLGLHVITHIIRWQWLGDASPLPKMLAARPALQSWLDELAALPAVQQTLPDRDENVSVMRKMAGLD